jgi:hypothetical protein
MHSGYWIGGLPAYQAGGPPLEFEKTGLTLLGLRGTEAGTCGCHKEGEFKEHCKSSLGAIARTRRYRIDTTLAQS